MFSALRSAVGWTAQCSRRGLTTAAQSFPSSPLVGLQQTGQSAMLVKSGSLSLGLQAEPVIPPLLLPISSLLRPQEAQQSNEEMLVELDPTVFSHPVRRDILHLCVVHYLDSLRQGTASTKNRSQIRGSGRKLRPQKRSGKARLGDKKSPMLRGGGVAFGPKPRDFSTQLPRKVIDMGMRVALSARVKERAFGVVNSLEWDSPKTRDLAERLEELSWGKTLFVTGHQEVPSMLERAASNIPLVETVTAEELTVYDAVKWPRLILDLAAVDWFGQTLGKRTLV
ncbi:39S ribosomal protein L4, mitochondrial [Phanerochaete sordida]|uniref:Large ribosomal subunit protein uL4m n=1 Tax=Phanerochaete sordida TaxID=48140 RepID=A0A9P3LBB5_9APHY|nr:39S ribosomal protein L4, mitochondrial [Phanerochaete sordida]